MMSFFTAVIIFWIAYQVFLSLLKKGRQLNKNFEPLKLPDSRSIRDAVQKSPAGFPQAVKSFMEGYIQTEGTQGREGSQELYILLEDLVLKLINKF